MSILPDEAVDTLEQLRLEFEELRTSGDRDDKKRLKEIPREVCETVRAMAISSLNDFHEALTVSDDVLNEFVDAIYHSHSWDFRDFLPSFADTGEDGPAPLLKDTEAGELHFMGTLHLREFQRIAADMSIVRGVDPEVAAERAKEFGKDRTPYDSSIKPHGLTSPLARARKPDTIDPSLSSIPSTSPLALSFYQARCSITARHIYHPLPSGTLHIDTGSPFLLYTAAGGSAGLNPDVTFWKLADFKTDVFERGKRIRTELWGPATHLAVDPIRELVYTADKRNIESFKYTTSPHDLFGGDSSDVDEISGETLAAVHTLDSRPSTGPLALAERGSKLLRAGEGEIYSWDVDGLFRQNSDSDSDGDERVRQRRRRGRRGTPDPFEDPEPEDEEDWQGTPPTNILRLEQPLASSNDIAYWSASPNNANVMLSTLNNTYSCLALDLQAGGKVTTRYLGHGGQPTGFSTSPVAEPTQFLTSAMDGVARLYDVREPLPGLSIQDEIRTALLVHVQGVPAIITGSDKYECIKVWDPRSSTRSCVYDLSTGNNPTTSLAWDASRHTLYAATECEDTKSFEYGRKYIKKKVPKPQRPRTQSEMDDSEYESEDFEWRRWPANAYHDDEYYGYVYDSGGHRIFRYMFGENADPKILPKGGRCLEDVEHY